MLGKRTIKQKTKRTFAWLLAMVMAWSSLNFGGVIVAHAEDENSETVTVNGTVTWAEGTTAADEVTVVLYAGEEAVEGKTVTTDASKEWKFEFTDLTELEDGKEYTVKVADTEDYTYKTVKGEDGTFTITGTAVEKSTDPEEPTTEKVTGSITWSDSNDNDGKRPTSVEVILSVEGEEDVTCTATADKDWAFEFTVAKDVEYTITVAETEFYEYTVDGTTITGTHELITTNVAGKITWEDEENKDELRPETVTVKLLVGDEVVDTIEANDDFSYDFGARNIYKDGETVVYTISCDEVEGYTATVNGYYITLTHDVDTEDAGKDDDTTEDAGDDDTTEDAGDDDTTEDAGDDDTTEDAGKDDDTTEDAGKDDDTTEDAGKDDTTEDDKKDEESEVIVGEWSKDENGNWTFVDEDGNAVSDTWAVIDGERYFFNEEGVMETGWVLDEDTWYYLAESGAMATGWVNDNGTWYYMEETGEMQTGWANDNGTWYYMNESGAMQTGWELVNGTWYYMAESGAMATGWVNDNGTWYYMNESGAMATGWVNDNGTWYYMNESGAMATGWVLDGATWYYMYSSGAMATGWVLDGTTWYYMNPSGAMATGWVLDGATWYYMYSSGAMAYSTVIDGYTLNASGAWVQ